MVSGVKPGLRAAGIETFACALEDVAVEFELEQLKIEVLSMIATVVETAV